MIEPQVGACCYRVHPKDRRRVQVQAGKGKRWRNIKRDGTPVTRDDPDDVKLMTFADPKGAELWVLRKGRQA